MEPATSRKRASRVPAASSAQRAMHAGSLTVSAISQIMLFVLVLIFLPTLPHEHLSATIIPPFCGCCSVQLTALRVAVSVASSSLPQHTVVGMRRRSHTQHKAILRVHLLLVRYHRLVNDGVQTLWGPPDIIPNRTQVPLLGGYVRGKYSLSSMLSHGPALSTQLCWSSAVQTRAIRLQQLMSLQNRLEATMMHRCMCQWHRWSASYHTSTCWLEVYLLCTGRTGVAECDGTVPRAAGHLQPLRQLHSAPVTNTR